MTSVHRGHLTVGSGVIRVETAQEHLQVKAGSGDIVLGAVANADALAGSGDIEVAGLHGRLTSKSGSGDLKVLRGVSGDIAIHRA